MRLKYKHLKPRKFGQFDSHDWFSKNKSHIGADILGSLNKLNISALLNQITIHTMEESSNLDVQPEMDGSSFREGYWWTDNFGYFEFLIRGPSL